MVFLIIISSLANLIGNASEMITRMGIVMGVCVAVYWIGGIFAFFIWPIVSPAFVFGTLLISLDIFGKDYPKLMEGFNLCVINWQIARKVGYKDGNKRISMD